MDLQSIFRQVNRQLSGGRVSAEYHPYVELKHTWRSRHNALYFRISDYMDRSSDEATESLAWHLLCKAYGKHCPEGMAERYHDHVRSREFWAPKRDTYLSRSRNLTLRPVGAHRDLSEVFAYVNGCYFGGSLNEPDLAWTKESPSSRLGFYFEPLDILAVNRVLDSQRVPRYVLEFVVYHELLHGVLDPGGTPLRRLPHTNEFRKREREFAMFSESEEWLRKLARKKRNPRALGVPQV